MFWSELVFAISLVGSRSGSVLGRYPRLRSVIVRKNPTFGGTKKPVLAALFRVDPSLVGRCSHSILERFGRSFIGKNPVWDKNPFLAAFLLQENPILWEKTCPFGGHRGRSPLLVVYSLPIFGRFLRGKNPFGKKPSSCWEKPSFVACFSSARYLFSTGLREVATFCRRSVLGKTLLERKTFIL